MKEPKYYLTKDGEKRFVGTEIECLTYLMQHQNFSSLWAYKHGGWMLHTMDGSPAVDLKKLEDI